MLDVCYLDQRPLQTQNQARTILCPAAKQVYYRWIEDGGVHDPQHRQRYSPQMLHCFRKYDKIFVDGLDKMAVNREACRRKGEAPADHVGPAKMLNAQPLAVGTAVHTKTVRIALGIASTLL
ncbi:hypothetical protein PHYSODRAFT_501528 [Phytophthora sojae]|uniref:Uncharacterized protein n=1 Tax=Phytophthora sojae (strain P6497) TaxID=1094619 RepID=G4ZIL3_PHYSP|nr:hypothetical protein PHYSODRAFT_501528 [Phytophthora sojae]EGZ17257.1 hypothetical protein PHYSODRAFT_501528 [Phytophthora sojae]|eukprot:XP_009526315.1 hypothetical protein PHYSODRAFT_501528 [Phytophthora sojae]